MGIRIGDETVEVEGKIEHRTAKAVLFEPTIGEKCWIPLSQISLITEPDLEGNVVIQMTAWIAGKNGLI
jgi:hypothetical protein